MKTKLPKGKLQVALEALERMKSIFPEHYPRVKHRASDTLAEIDSMPDEPAAKGFCVDCEKSEEMNSYYICNRSGAYPMAMEKDDFCSRFEAKEKAE